MVKIKGQQLHYCTAGTFLKVMNQNRRSHETGRCANHMNVLGLLVYKAKAQDTEGMLYDSFVLLITSQVLLISFMQITPLTSEAILAWLL